LNTKKYIYWYCQFIGWSFYITINSIFSGLNYKSTLSEYLLYVVMLLAGIFISHGYRRLVISVNVLRKKIPYQLFFIVVFSFIKGGLFFLIILAQWRVMGINLSSLSFISSFEYVLNFSGVFCMWNVIYFGFHYFQNYRRAEINSLRYLAASRESELNHLKAQLNPHFIFNCMNSIRALIDEHPANAKTAITRLSNLLRNTLILDKDREIPVEKELQLVRDYLDLEKIRYEERLNFIFDIRPQVMTQLLPPFLIQSQVENAIKHGISKLPGPGEIKITVKEQDSELRISVANTGKLNTQQPLTGVGFVNSIQRIELLYGKNAGITIHEADEWVIVNIHLPLRVKS
jgi:two-component system, LytTR family, sensor kinase